MHRHPFALFSSAILALTAALPVHAKKNEPIPQLTAKGETLKVQYTGMLDELKAQVLSALPAVDAAQKNAFMTARAEWSALKKPQDDAATEARKKYEADSERIETASLDAARALLANLDSFLASDKLDIPLMKIAILTHGTPGGLAEFAQQGAEQQKLIESLLSNEKLMRQIVDAGGANGGEYGEALQIYAKIQKASARAREEGSIFQRLALGTALHTPWDPTKEELAGVYGIVHRSELNSDHVERYMHYEKAYLAGELDPAFKDMNVWECRFITDSQYTNEELTWMRQMVRTYRPDQAVMDDYKWRYVRFIKDDVPYCSTTHDPTIGTKAQEEIALGGICGRRAFLGRLALRAFGIPTRASTQSGHAALSHWTPDGWVICFGAWWSVAWCGPQGGLDILLETQIRNMPGEYSKVQRAQWIADALGEENVSIRDYGVGGGFWESLAFCKKQVAVKAAEVKALELIGGMKLGESDELIGDEVAEEIQIPEEDKTITTAADGTITLPAVACYSPRGASDRVLFMKSHDKGMQLHYSRLGARPELVKYRVEVPAAGEYELTALLATVSIKQNIVVRMNREEPVTYDIPYTKGMWMKSAPLRVKLEEGRNMISITARTPNRGVSFKHFELKPVK
ncbi:MAG: hypothetical protein RI957_2201 [Verrucomicrobiota bacterium]|jgi:hypothetical protein